MPSNRQLLRPLLAVRDLKAYFFTRSGIVRAVNGISFDVMPGETLGLVGSIQSIQHAIRLPGQADRAYCHALELAGKRRCHIGAILLDLQLGLDADFFERALCQLCHIEEEGT